MYLLLRQAFPDNYTLFKPNTSSSYALFDRQSDTSSRWLVEIMPVDHMSLRRYLWFLNETRKTDWLPGVGAVGRPTCGT
jgi:response regulator of citrate/malate metabolism